jgi:hypothetical protein
MYIIILSCSQKNELDQFEKDMVNFIKDSKYTTRAFKLIDSVNLKLPADLFLDASPIIRTWRKGFVIFNNESLNILVFNTKGQLINKFGRRGDGPGEFNKIVSGTVDKYDNVYTYDNILKRINCFNINGKLNFILNVNYFDAETRLITVDNNKNIYLHHTPSKKFNGFISIFDSTGYKKTIVNGNEKYESYYLRGFLEGGIVVDKNNNVYECNTYNYKIRILRSDDTKEEFGIEPSGFKELIKANYNDPYEKIRDNFKKSTIVRNLFLIYNQKLLLLEILKFNEYDPIDVDRRFIVYSTNKKFLGELIISKLNNFDFSDGEYLYQLWNPPPLPFEDINKNSASIKIYKLNYSYLKN